MADEERINVVWKEHRKTTSKKPAVRAAIAEKKHERSMVKNNVNGPTGKKRTFVGETIQNQINPSYANMRRMMNKLMGTRIKRAVVAQHQAEEEPNEQRSQLFLNYGQEQLNQADEIAQVAARKHNMLVQGNMTAHDNTAHHYVLNKKGKRERTYSLRVFDPPHIPAQPSLARRPRQRRRVNGPNQ